MQSRTKVTKSVMNNGRHQEMQTLWLQGKGRDGIRATYYLAGMYQFGHGDKVMTELKCKDCMIFKRIYDERSTNGQRCTTDTTPDRKRVYANDYACDKIEEIKEAQ